MASRDRRELFPEQPSRDRRRVPQGPYGKHRQTQNVEVRTRKGDLIATGESYDLHYRHDQSPASTTWTITHSMGKHPSVTVVDSTGQECFGQVDHLSEDKLTINFKAAFSGVAFLN